MESGEANKRWGEMLARWAIPEETLAAAPATPYFFDPQVFATGADEAIARAADTPSDAQAREALPPGGTLLDVGCGAGAASLRLRPHRLIGVDASGPMRQAFTERASQLGIDAITVAGSWPEVAPEAPISDVVVCHHVFYNVANLAPFVIALGDHGRQRVVVELTAVHPMAWMAPYWKALHGLEQPDRPVAEDAMAVMEELGLAFGQSRWTRPYQTIGESDDDALRRVARRLCLPTSRHDELRELLAVAPPPIERDVVSLWWEPAQLG